MNGYAVLKARLEEYLAGNGVKYGVYFEDLATGQSFGVNEKERIHAASTIKVPVVLYLNELAAQGKIDWNEKIVYDPQMDYQDGAGALQFFAQQGKRYSLRTLATLSITLSDNIAHRMLLRYLGKENVASFMSSLGATTVFPDGVSITTARDMGVYMKAVWDFAQRHPDLGGRLLDDLSNTIWDVGLTGSLPEGVVVAHKEGNITGVANDVGIVFTKRPYILVVLSDGVGDTDDGFRRISKISRMVYDYHMTLGDQ